MNRAAVIGACAALLAAAPSRAQAPDPAPGDPPQAGASQASPEALQQTRTTPAQGPPPGYYQFTGRLIGPQPGAPKPMPTIANPYEQTAAVLGDGRRLFIWYNCYGCHGGRAGGGMGPSLRDAEWLYGDSEPAIFNSIAEGRQHGMPAWGAKLPVEDIWKLAAYIKSMGTPAEPDAPPANPSLREQPADAPQARNERHDGRPDAD
jgi:cytochrome c oxidase cbb3-type subunit 3